MLNAATREQYHAAVPSSAYSGSEPMTNRRSASVTSAKVSPVAMTEPAAVVVVEVQTFVIAFESPVSRLRNCRR